MSKGVKKALGFVIAIAIPFAAPAIAGALATAGLTGFGGWLGSAAVGAGLGAANAAVTGGNIAQGALFGGLGAGINAGLQGLPMIGTATPAAGTAGVAAGTNPLVAAAQDMATSAGRIPTVAEAAAAAAGTIPIPAAISPTQLTFMEAVGKIPETFGNALTDPTKLADFTLRAGSMLVSGIMTEDPMAGLNDQERQQVELVKQELLRTQQTDTALFNQQLTLAKDVMNEARQYNSQYFAQQTANQQMLKDAAVRQEIEMRNRGEGSQGSDAALDAEVRRANIAAGRNQGSAYSAGLQSAMATKSQKLATAAGLFPKNVPTGAQGKILETMQGYTRDNDARNTGLQSTFMDLGTRLLPPTSDVPTSVGNKGGKP